MTYRQTFSAIVLAGCALVAAPAHADDVLENAPVARRELRYRASRHEVSAVFGSTFGDPYKRSLMPGVRYGLHLNDWLALGADLMVGIPVATGTAEEIELKVMKSNPNFVMEATHLRFLSSAGVSIAPLVGKFLAFGSLPVNFDFHANLTIGIAGIAGTENIPEEISIAPGVGGGVRVFLSRVLAITADVADVFIDRTLAVDRNSKPRGGKFEGNLLFTAGLSFFMPPDLGRAD